MNTEKLFNPLVSFDLEAKELVALCPPEFYSPNPWSDFVEEVYTGFDRSMTPDSSAWFWKQSDRKEQEVQKLRFFRLLASALILYKDKMALAGFMLSLMLQETPPYIPKNYLS